jgi:sucrose-6-phosphate hydrolase SacC (GH32 family)
MNKANTYFIYCFLLCFISCQKDIIDNEQQPISVGLQSVLNIPLNEGQGNQVTEIINSEKLNIQGRGLNWTQGVSNTSFYFDGLSNSINGSIKSNLLPKDRLVISIWVAPKTYPIADAALLALTEKNSSTGVTLALSKLGQVKFQYYINQSYAQVVSNKIIDRSRWSHIVAVLNTKNSKVQLYINGQLDVNSNVPSGTISWKSSINPIQIGKHTNDEKAGLFSIDYYAGLIDEIEILSGEANEDNIFKLFSKYNVQSEVDYKLNIDYTDDYTRPIYHPIQKSGWANEAYGLIHWNGQYHMFFQKNEVFLGIAQQNWGHLQSSDLINWEEKEPILWPTLSFDSAGTWSGCSYVIGNIPHVAYTGVNGIKAGIGIAKSNDNFASLSKLPNNPAIPSAPTSVDMDFRDPFIWKEGDSYHMIVGSGKRNIGGNIVLYTSQDGITWLYKGVPFQGQKNRGDGNFWEMPVMIKFSNGKYGLIVQNTPDGTPARTKYWIGNYTNNMFIPDFINAKNLELINGFLSPTVTETGDGKIVAFGIIPDEVNAEHHLKVGWANLFSIAQQWELSSNNSIEIRPLEGIEQLRDTQLFDKSLIVGASDQNNLSEVKSKYYEVNARIDINNANEFGIIIGKTPNSEEFVKIGYNKNSNEWFIDTTKSSQSNLVRRDIRKGSVNLENTQIFDLRIFVDGSVIEVFINDKYHFTGRFFPTFKNADGIDIYALGGTINTDIKIYSLK